MKENQISDRLFALEEILRRNCSERGVFSAKFASIVLDDISGGLIKLLQCLQVFEKCGLSACASICMRESAFFFNYYCICL